MADVQPTSCISFTKIAAKEKRTVQVEGSSLLCDVACGTTRPLVPVLIRLKSSTPSAAWATLAYVAPDEYYQHSLSERVWAKTWWLPAAPLHAILVPVRRFSHMHMDLVGPLPASLEDHMYLLTAIDK